VLGLLREDDAREVVTLRILLPIDEMIGRLNVQRVAVNGRAVVRCRSQANDLRAERNCALVVVASLVMKCDSDGHCYSDLEELFVNRRPNVVDRALQTVDIFVKSSRHDVLNRSVIQPRPELPQQALRFALIGANR